jgi:hypothetical protein
MSLEIIINYLNKYPLFSSKYLDFNDWKEVVFLIFEKKHNIEEGINKTESVKNSMNRQRTKFTWDHLIILSF